nr:reverse transcriptase domain-containing protein [Tanacetum cinerariifolium]
KVSPVEQDTKEITDKEHSNCQGSTTHVQPPVVPISIPELDVLKIQPKPNIPYPSRLNDQKLREKATTQIENFFQIFHDLHFGISFVNALLLMPKFASTIKNLLTNKDKLFELAKVPLNENCSVMLLKKLPEKLRDPGKFLIPCDFPGIDVNSENPWWGHALSISLKHSQASPNVSSNLCVKREISFLRRRVPNIVEPKIRTIEEVVPMADRTMEELLQALQAPTEGYGEAIVIPKILAENFEIKTNLLQLVQTNKFHGFERDNPHTHISNFKRMTSTLKYRDVPNDAIKLMLFPYSLEGASRIWYEKEPPNSILTWDDLVNKFVNQFFPPSKTTHLKNKISLFTQRFEETFGEAWECFKEMLRECPHHGFSELT